MIAEDYVSFETAKLLKEKGFEGDCDTAYHNGQLVDSTMFGFCLGGEFCFTPTQQMAMKWLREVHKINLNIDWNPTFKDYFVEIFKPTLLYSTVTYQNYEEAVEDAIKYCLENLI